MDALQKENPSLGAELENENSSPTKAFYSSVTRDAFEYKIGECCYIEPSAFGFNVKHPPVKKAKSERKEVWKEIIGEVTSDSKFVWYWDSEK